jgi:DNA-binding NarL/FixJ family response regulator
MKYKIIIYDDDEILRHSISYLLNLESDFLILATKSNPLNVLADIEEYSPDVILMDIEMPAMNGVEAVKTIRTKHANLPILMLTVFEDNENIYNALCAGASGYLLKKTDPETLANGIIDVLNGGAPMTGSIAKKVLQIFAHKPQHKDAANELLTKREVELLGYLVKGMSYKMIAADMYISLETVRSHIKNIYKKLEVKNAASAVALAINERLV